MQLSFLDMLSEQFDRGYCRWFGTIKASRDVERKARAKGLPPLLSKVRQWNTATGSVLLQRIQRSLTELPAIRFEGVVRKLFLVTT